MLKINKSFNKSFFKNQFRTDSKKISVGHRKTKWRIMYENFDTIDFNPNFKLFQKKFRFCFSFLNNSVVLKNI